MAKMLPFVLGCAVAGLIGALVGGLVRGDGDLPPASEPARTEADPQIARLADSVERLTGRIEILEQGVASGRPAASSPAMADVPEAVAEAIGTPAGEAAPAAPDALEEKVREVIAKDREKRSERIGLRFSEMAAEREKRMLDSLTEEHGLTPHQRDEMTKILERRRKAVGEFFRLMFGPGREGEEVDRAAIRAKIEDVQTETTTALQNLLSPSQYEAFEAQDPGSRMGGMGGFGPPRGAGRVR